MPEILLLVNASCKIVVKFHRSYNVDFIHPSWSLNLFFKPRRSQAKKRVVLPSPESWLNHFLTITKIPPRHFENSGQFSHNIKCTLACWLCRIHPLPPPPPSHTRTPHTSSACTVALILWDTFQEWYIICHNSQWWDTFCKGLSNEQCEAFDQIFWKKANVTA